MFNGDVQKKSRLPKERLKSNHSSFFQGNPQSNEQKPDFCISFPEQTKRFPCINNV